MTERFLIWRDWVGRRTEAARVTLTDSGVSAAGTQIGGDPAPYRLDYELDARDRWVTRSLELEASGDGWNRGLSLARDEDGTWRCDAGIAGEVDLPDPGGSLTGLEDALDCDLGLSPLTNLMPIRRHALHENPGAHDFVMAWVEVPALAIHASAQRYEHVSRNEYGSVVRFVDRGMFAGFTAELECDSDGLVRVYPELARRVG